MKKIPNQLKKKYNPYMNSEAWRKIRKQKIREEP